MYHDLTHVSCHDTYHNMIQGTKGKLIAAVIAGKPGKGFPSDLVRRAERKVAILDSARDLNDLRIPPSNNLEALSGDRKGQHSIRINKQWRICFKWDGTDATEVEITDYH
ncbi:type II toxin-antitoxin system RelE/ParE family toxin [Pseudohalocynthiibacter aestuariivivens]|uniref:Type II toxin-antitoxin system RelE/ParE family toxin n=1 Tax=Pseudohalocynthiibacter aestuariivivens TaxID=1591409 RepID=A0ABV5JF06_9RHOB